MSKLIYLATPYSKFHGGRDLAYKYACRKAMDLMEEGYKVFSPIAHSHSIEQEAGKVKDGDWWLDQDFAILQMCDELWVYKLPGWDTSYGVTSEINFAAKCGITIVFLEFQDNNEEQLELFD